MGGWPVTGVQLTRALAVTAWGSVLVASACHRSESRIGEAPLGWDGPIEAQESRQWPKGKMDSVVPWVVGDEPVFVVVPDSAERVLFGVAERHQRYVNEATVLPDGRVVLLYGLSEPDSILLHIFDPESDEEVLIPAPRGDDGQSPSWVHVNMIAHGGEIILKDSNERLLVYRGGEGMSLGDRRGGFARPPSPENGVAKLLGAFPDGSLAVMVESGSTAATIVSSTLVVWPAAGGNHAPEARVEKLVLTTATHKDPASSRSPAPWAHRPRFTSSVAGDTIWVVPTERPELVAVHRSGDILLKVEWDSGDRSIPAGAPPFWEGAERFPATASLKVGTDGLIYVQTVSLQGTSPLRGPEWLVFSPAGELVARLDIPGRWPGTAVLAFGDGAVVVKTRNDEAGVQEVRVYGISKSG